MKCTLPVVPAVTRLVGISQFSVPRSGIFSLFSECGSNEVYSSCSSRCKEACRNYVMFCPEVCVPGCYCKPGYKRLGSSCIPESQCPGGFKT